MLTTFLLCFTVSFLSYVYTGTLIRHHKKLNKLQEYIDRIDDKAISTNLRCLHLEGHLTSFLKQNEEEQKRKYDDVKMDIQIQHALIQNVRTQLKTLIDIYELGSAPVQQSSHTKQQQDT